MKKLLSTILACVIWLTSGMILTGCNKKVEIDSISVKSGTINTTVEQNANIDTSNLVIIVKYSDKTTKEVKKSSGEIQVTQPDTSTLGEKTMTITYKDKSCEVTITVVAAQPHAKKYKVYSYDSALWTEYESKRNAKTDPETTFFDQKEILIAGIDNPFNFRIVASVMYEGEDDQEDVAFAEADITISELVGGEYNFDSEESNQWTELQGTNLTSLMKIDPETYDIKFENGAIGKTFKFTFSAKNVAAEADPNLTKFTAVVKVQEGFNVYTAEDLSMFDTTAHHKEVRDAVCEKYGLDKATFDVNQIKAIYLQADIALCYNKTTKNLPDYYFYQEDDPITEKALSLGVDITGSLKNYYGTGVFARTMTAGQHFVFNGNYFSIDASKIPLEACGINTGDSNALSKLASTDLIGLTHDTSVDDKTQLPNYITGFQTLFWTGNVTTNITSPTDVTVKNMYFTGNSQVSAAPRYSGGIMQFKSACVNLNAYNTISKNFYVTYFPDDPEEATMVDSQKTYPHRTNENAGYYTIDHCKAYDSYQCFIYANNAKQIVISNCEFDNCGGPAIIADHDLGANADKDPEGNTAPGVDIYNSKITSEVASDSPWILSQSASSIASTLMLADGLFSNFQTGKTMIHKIENHDHINLIALIKANGTLDDSKPVKGYIRIFEDEAEYNSFYEGVEDRRHVSKTTNYGLDFFANNAGNQNLSDIARTGKNILQANRGGYIEASTQPSTMDGQWANGIKKDNCHYCNVYIYNGMGAVIGLYDNPAA